MTKDVLVAIKGLQFEGDMDAEAIEVINKGEYYKKNEGHYVIFDEVTEGFKEKTKNILHVKGDSVELTKRGLVNVHMSFEENKKNMTQYSTPYGNIMIGIDTKSIKMEEKEDRLQIGIEYALELNYEHFADCNIEMDIRSKNKGATLM
ncbi:MAG: DUF1934 domain-containing protein [Lachnospiraceae bacterium]|nr:DUF1934 domain-containing protein [Lachnospiraceae bacterium]MBR3683289.1 DUF1934 domain-containing protein [Lachnospiraceae bacterium]